MIVTFLPNGLKTGFKISGLIFETAPPSQAFAEKPFKFSGSTARIL
jgi:hypothetical protein